MHIAEDSIFSSFGSFCQINAVHNVEGIAKSSLNITGKRRFLSVQFGKNNKNVISALYDTGAAPTAISVQTLRLARNAGSVGAKIENHGITLTNASKTPMEVHSVHWVTMMIAGRQLTEPVMVLQQLSGDGIIGQNIIETHGLFYDFNKSAFAYASLPRGAAEGSWKSADVRAIGQCVIPANSAKLVSCTLVDRVSGERMPPQLDFISDFRGAPLSAATDHNGVTRLYVSNLEDVEISLGRGDFLGTAEPESAFYVDHEPTTSGDVAGIMAAVAPIRKDLPSASRNNRRRKKVIAEPPKRAPPPPNKDCSDQLSPAKRILINDAIQRSKIPRAEQSKYFRLLAKYNDTISEDAADLGHSKTVVHDIKLRNEEPVYTKQYSLPEQELTFIKDSVKDWLKNGVIERAHSRFNSAIFTVRKKEGHGLRVVLDYRKLNANSLPDRYMN